MPLYIQEYCREVERTRFAVDSIEIEIENENAAAPDLSVTPPIKKEEKQELK